MTQILQHVYETAAQLDPQQKREVYTSQDTGYELVSTVCSFEPEKLPNLFLVYAKMIQQGQRVGIFTGHADISVEQARLDFARQQFAERQKDVPIDLLEIINNPDNFRVRPKAEANGQPAVLAISTLGAGWCEPEFQLFNHEPSAQRFVEGMLSSRSSNMRSTLVNVLREREAPVIVTGPQNG